jgi:hypothetical protein
MVRWRQELLNGIAQILENEVAVDRVCCFDVADTKFATIGKKATWGILPKS